MQPKVATRVSTKKVVKQEAWEEEDEIFSDEDLFAEESAPLFDEREEEADTIAETPARKSKTVPITVSREIGVGARAEPKAPPPIDIAAVTFYS